LLLRSKLLLLLRSKLLLLLLLGKVLAESPGVELLVDGLVGVEVCGVEDGSPLSLVPLVCELPPSDLIGPPGGFVRLLLDHGGLESQHGFVTFLLELEGSGLDGGGGSGGLADIVGEPGGVVGSIFDDLQVSELIQVTVFTFYVSLLVLSFEFERSVGGLVTDSVGAVLVDLIDLFEDDSRVGCGGGSCGGGGGGFCGGFSDNCWFSAGHGGGEGFQFQLYGGDIYGGDTLLLGSCGHQADDKNQTRLK